MPDPARFWTRFARRYAAMPMRDPDSYAEKLRRTRALLTPDAMVVEVGCGTGSTALELARDAAQIVASDITPAMIEIAKGKAQEAGVHNVTFCCAGWEDTPVPDGGADMILAHNLLHLLADWPDAVARMADWLRPGGHLVTTTLFTADLPLLARALVPPLGATGLIPPVQRIPQGRFETTLARAGLQIVDQWHPTARSARFHICRKS